MTKQENSSAKEKTGQTFESVLGVEGVEAELSGLGIKVPSPQQRDAIRAVLSLENCSVVADFPESDWGFLLIPLVIEASVSSSPGATVLIAPAEALSSLEKRLSRASLKATKAIELAETTGGYEGSLVYGTAQEVQDFFNHEVSRATDLGRVMLIGQTESDTPALSDLLATATKRARRPQFVVYHPSSLSDEVRKCLKNFFQLPRQDVEHLFYEVDGELLSKPTSLADFIEGERASSTLVYANQPSDADFIEVMLRKRGISCMKLIGNVSSQRLSQTMAQVKAGKIKALIATDVSSRSVDPHEFELIVNYSIPSDPEVYVHRTEGAGSGESLKKVISLVGPLDRANFHYLQKIVETSFSEITPPSAKDVAQAQFSNLVVEAKESAKGIPEKTRALAALVSEHESREDIISFLLASLASAQTAAPAEPVYSEEDSDGMSDGGRGGQRGGRGERNSRRSGRGREGGRRGRDDDYREEGQRAEGHSDNSGSSRNKRNEGREEKPTVRVCRIYVESSSERPLNGEFFNGLVEKSYADSKNPIIRLSSRPLYTFLDIVEEQADDFIAELENAGGPEGEQLFVRKAITLATPLDDDGEDSGAKPDTAQDSEAAEAKGSGGQDASLEEQAPGAF